MPQSSEPSPEPDLPPATPMALAFEWVARITAVSLLMFLPGVGGQWLDDRFGTEFLALLGFGLGFCLGLGTLLAMVASKGAVHVSRELTVDHKYDQGDGSDHEPGRF